MKLSSDSKKALDAVIPLKPNNNDRYYTINYVLTSTDLSMTTDQFLGILDTLETAKAIKWGDEEHTAFSLTEQGRSYKEIDRLEKSERRKERIYGFFVGGILVAVIAAVINAFILRKLGLG